MTYETWRAWACAAVVADAASWGYDVHERCEAQSGTWYVRLRRGALRLAVRISDHGASKSARRSPSLFLVTRGRRAWRHHLGRFLDLGYVPGVGGMPGDPGSGRSRRRASMARNRPPAGRATRPPWPLQAFCRILRIGGRHEYPSGVGSAHKPSSGDTGPVAFVPSACPVPPGPIAAVDHGLLGESGSATPYLIHRHKSYAGMLGCSDALQAVSLQRDNVALWHACGSYDAAGH